MTSPLLTKQHLLALLAQFPEDSQFAFWEGGGLSVLDASGAYVGYIDLAFRAVAITETAGKVAVADDPLPFS